MNGKNRESNFELLRLVAMFCIVYYHLLVHFVVPVKGDGSFYSALELPLHIGVPLFIFISGYFGIKPTVFGGVKIFLVAFVYSVPLQLVFDLYNSMSLKELLKDVLFLSYGPYWFMRVYLMFYLFVPIVNRFLDGIDYRMRWYSLCVLAFINFWFGAFTSGDVSLSTGKNIVNFTFLYILANTFKHYKYVWMKVKKWHFLLAYFLLNVFLVTIYYFSPNIIFRMIILRTSFGYNSPILLLNASLLFLYFAKLNFKSLTINRISASVLAIYLISEHNVVKLVLNQIVNKMQVILDTSIALLLGVFVLTLGIMMICILIDKVYSPVYCKIVNRNIIIKR